MYLADLLQELSVRGKEFPFTCARQPLHLKKKIIINPTRS
jgi:hypothetical protein